MKFRLRKYRRWRRITRRWDELAKHWGSYKTHFHWQFRRAVKVRLVQTLKGLGSALVVIYLTDILFYLLDLQFWVVEIGNGEPLELNLRNIFLCGMLTHVAIVKFYDEGRREHEAFAELSKVEQELLDARFGGPGMYTEMLLQRQAGRLLRLIVADIIALITVFAVDIWLSVSGNRPELWHPLGIFTVDPTNFWLCLSVSVVDFARHTIWMFFRFFREANPDRLAAIFALRLASARRR